MTDAQPNTEISQDAITASLTAPGFKVQTAVGSETIFSDHAAADGTSGTAPTPFQLLYASICSCMAITVQMYAQRKQWPLERVDITLIPTRKAPGPLEGARVELKFTGDLDRAQLERLRHVAGRCPVHRSLAEGVAFEEVLV